MAVFEYVKLITAKHYENLCMDIDVTQEDCGSKVLVRLDTNLVSRSDGTIRDIKSKYAEAVANFDENDPVKWFGNVLRQQQVLHFYRIGTNTIEAMEDAVHRIQACTGQLYIRILGRDRNVAYYYSCHQSDWECSDGC